MPPSNGGDRLIVATACESYNGDFAGYLDQITARSESAKPSSPAMTPVTEGYSGSKNSAVFHKAGCKAAAKNPVRYASHDEAVKAGRNPMSPNADQKKVERTGRVQATELRGHCGRKEAMKALLIRIGVDQAYGGWNAPVDADWRFVYVPIPESPGTRFHPGLRR